MVKFVSVVLLTLAVLFFNGLLQVLGMSIKGQFRASEKDELLQRNLSSPSWDWNLQFNASNQSASPERDERHRNWLVALQRQQKQWKTLKGKFECA